MTAAGPCRSALGLSETTGLCPHHDPERAEEMRLVRAAGSRASSDIARLARRIRESVAPANLPSFPPNSLARLSLWHQWTATAVATGELEAKTAREITLSLKELRPVLLAVGMERRVKELEAALKKARRELEGRHRE
jgi:hypothetical protein